jgi:hypothetical protein
MSLERVRAWNLGLVAMWSRTFGYVVIHDPTTGDWHELETRAAPDWAVREARKRKELWRGGDRRAYQLTRKEMEDLFEADREEEEEGIIEEHPLEE